MDGPRLDVGVWNGRDLTGEWLVTYKIDGVRAIWWPAKYHEGTLITAGAWRSRADKPLHNIAPPHIVWGFNEADRQMWNCELYLGTLKNTLRACRTINLKPDTPSILPEHLYPLFPVCDPRLVRGVMVDPTADQIIEALNKANAEGYEGLVLRQGEQCLKVKPSDTWDVLVLGMVEGTGKHKGRMGYLQTHMGDVGTGFTDEERAAWWERRWSILGGYGTTIEVEAMSITPAGKFRHPRFVRERFDKVADK